MLHSLGRNLISVLVLTSHVELACLIDPTLLGSTLFLQLKAVFVLGCIYFMEIRLRYANKAVTYNSQEILISSNNTVCF